MRGELVRIGVDPHGVFGGAEHVDLRDAAHHRDALRDRALGVFVDRRHRQRGRAEHEEEHRLIARVDLLVRRRRRHLRRQLARRLGDHRLHVLRGRVDVPAEVELQHDVRAALRAGRIDRVQPGDGGELLFERQRDRRRHGLRARAGEAGAHLDGGEVHRRQIADRQQPVRHRAEHDDPQHDEGGRDRAFDKQGSDVHDVVFWPAAFLTLTRLPGTSRRWPSVTTVSPLVRPLLITDSSPAVRITPTDRNSTVWSGFTTKT